MKFKVIPITLKQANSFVTANHRHHSSVAGCKFALGLTDGDLTDGELIGVAICGRPVSRFLDDGLTLEVNRLCTDGTPNACSFLYSRVVRIAKIMGYERVITYTLESENGASLKASGFALDGITNGGTWSCPSRPRNTEAPIDKKKRWLYLCKKCTSCG